MLTWAIRKALREEHYSETGERQKNRTHTLPLKEVQKLFDNTAEDNVERRKAFAEVMGLTLKQAAKESDKRIETAEAKGPRKAKKAKKAEKAEKAEK
jgi:hypothetical protein